LALSDHLATRQEGIATHRARGSLPAESLIVFQTLPDHIAFEILQRFGGHLEKAGFPIDNL
jgi:hypothetical protein